MRFGAGSPMERSVLERSCCTKQSARQSGYYDLSAVMLSFGLRVTSSLWRWTTAILPWPSRGFPTRDPEQKFAGLLYIKEQLYGIRNLVFRRKQSVTIKSNLGISLCKRSFESIKLVGRVDGVPWRPHFFQSQDTFQPIYYTSENRHLLLDGMDGIGSFCSPR